MSLTEYPKRMVHPAFKKSDPKPVPGTEVYGPQGNLIRAAYHGDPDRFPPVDVPNADKEEEYRAKGYHPYGETPMNVIAFKEYPMMLSHPDYEPGEEAIVAVRDGNGKLISPAVPAAPPTFAPIQVNDRGEEETWTARGYERPGKSDPDAVQASISSPHVPGRVTNEYPKMVNGVMIDDPNAPAGPAEYPKWIVINGHPDGGRVVNSRHEEHKLLGTAPVEDKQAKARAAREMALRAKEAAEAAIAAADAELDDGDPTVPIGDVVAEAIATQAADTAERDTLFAEAQALGLNPHHLWGAKRLTKAIAEARATQAA